MSTVTASTPIDLVEGVYASLAERVAARPRAPRPAADPDREDPRQPPLRPRPGARARRQLRRLPSRSRGDAGRHGADGAAAVHDRRAGRGGRPVDRALRPPHPGQGRGAHRPRRGDRHQRGGLRLPPLGVGEVRHRLLGPGERDHPPGRARELRLPRRDDDRHRLAHAERRRPRHGRHRGRRRRRRRRDDRLPVQRALAQGDRRAAHRHRCRAGRARRTSSSRSPASSPSRAAPGRSSSTTARAPIRSRPRARGRSATWAPRSGPPRRCSRTTRTWRCTSRRPGARRSPPRPTAWPSTCDPTTGRCTTSSSRSTSTR